MAYNTISIAALKEQEQLWFGSMRKLRPLFSDRNLPWAWLTKW